MSQDFLELKKMAAPLEVPRGEGVAQSVWPAPLAGDAGPHDDVSADLRQGPRIQPTLPAHPDDVALAQSLQHPDDLRRYWDPAPSALAPHHHAAVLDPRLEQAGHLPDAEAIVQDQGDHGALDVGQDRGGDPVDLLPGVVARQRVRRVPPAQVLAGVPQSVPRLNPSEKGGQVLPIFPLGRERLPLELAGTPIHHHLPEHPVDMFHCGRLHRADNSQNREGTSVVDKRRSAQPTVLAVQQIFVDEGSGFHQHITSD